jgi:hypothetical protein
VWRIPYRNEGTPIEGSGTVEDKVVRNVKCGVYVRQGIKISSENAYAESPSFQKELMRSRCLSGRRRKLFSEKQPLGLNE